MGGKSQEASESDEDIIASRTLESGANVELRRKFSVINELLPKRDKHIKAFYDRMSIVRGGGPKQGLTLCAGSVVVTTSGSSSVAKGNYMFCGSFAPKNDAFPHQIILLPLIDTKSRRGGTVDGVYVAEESIDILATQNQQQLRHGDRRGGGSDKLLLKYFRERDAISDDKVLAPHLVGRGHPVPLVSFSISLCLFAATHIVYTNNAATNIVLITQMRTPNKAPALQHVPKDRRRSRARVTVALKVPSSLCCPSYVFIS